jgi:hypothetical protein
MSTYDDASLIYYPSGYKEDKIYSLKPTDGSGDLTFTRASSATRVNSDGLIESPRTNLVLYSEEFDNAYWTKTNVTITANATTAPDGNLTADKLVENSVNGNHFIYRSQATFTASASYFQSWYVKAGERYKVRIQDASDGTFFAAYNLNTGSLIDEGTNTIGNTTITPLLNGWYRLTLLLNQATSAKYAGIILLPDSYTAGDSITYQGNGTSGVYIWGAQIEAGSTATDYIPTTNSARTTFAGITQDGTSASNIPRIDYTGGGCGKLLLEPQRTNLVLYSNNTFADGTNGSSATTTTPSVIDGVYYRKMTATAVDGNIFASVSQLSSTPTGLMCFSVFLKKGSCDDVQIIDQNTTGKSIRVNLSNGAIISQSLGLICGVESYGNDVYRVYIVQDFTSIGFRYDLYAKEIGDFYYTTAQMESGSYPTSVIITNGTAVTRVADSASKTPISSFLNTANPFTFYLNFERPDAIQSSTGYQMIGLDNGGYGQRIKLLNRGNQKQFTIEVYNGVTLSQTSAITNTQNIKVAIVYDGSTSYKVFHNGVLFQTLTNSATTLTRLISGENGTNYTKENYQSIMIFPTALADADLIALTTL